MFVTYICLRIIENYKWLFNKDDMQNSDLPIKMRTYIIMFNDLQFQSEAVYKVDCFNFITKTDIGESKLS